MTSLWYLSWLYVWVYQGCFWHCIKHDKCRWSWQAVYFYRGYVSGEASLPSSGSKYELLKMSEFIKAVSDTVLNMINALYHDKPFILSGLRFETSSSPIMVCAFCVLCSHAPIIGSYFIWANIQAGFLILFSHSYFAGKSGFTVIESAYY